MICWAWYKSSDKRCGCRIVQKRKIRFRKFYRSTYTVRKIFGTKFLVPSFVTLIFQTVLLIIVLNIMEQRNRELLSLLVKLYKRCTNLVECRRSREKSPNLDQCFSWIIELHRFLCFCLDTQRNIQISNCTRKLIITTTSPMLRSFVNSKYTDLSDRSSFTINTQPSIHWYPRMEIWEGWGK